MKKFLASLINRPWLVEEAWLEVMLNAWIKEDFDYKALHLQSSSPASNTANIRDNVGILSISGPIFSKPNILTEWFGIGCVIGRIASDLRALVDNPDVESVILDIDSPGGEITGINEAAGIISVLKDQKPITAYIGGSGASGAYWLASAASEIVIDATARVGSIGVVAGFRNPQDKSEYFEMVNTASPNKRVDPTTDKGKAVITSELDDLANVFIGTVAKNRGVSVETVISDFGKGGILVGQKAVDAGMADRLGSFEGLMEEKLIYEGETSMKLTMEELKANHKEIYDSVVASVTPDTSALEAAHSAALTAKDQEITGLKTKLEEATTTASSFSDRVKTLEKRDALRDEETAKTKAGTILASALAESTVPKRLHAKVEKQIDFNAFMKDGNFDAAGYTEAVKTEVKDWEASVGETSVSGIWTAPKTVVPDENTEDDEVVARLSGYLKKEA